MLRLEEIKQSLVKGAEFEGKDYAHKWVSQEDIYWLINEVEKNQQADIFKNEGMAIFIKGNLTYGVHPDNLESNLKYLAKGAMGFDWVNIAKNNGVQIENIGESTNKN
jgi:hypothetical protein